MFLLETQKKKIQLNYKVLSNQWICYVVVWVVVLLWGWCMGLPLAYVNLWVGGSVVVKSNFVLGVQCHFGLSLRGV